MAEITNLIKKLKVMKKLLCNKIKILYLLIRIAEVLNLCLCELSNSEQALARSNLITI